MADQSFQELVNPVVGVYEDGLIVAPYLPQKKQFSWMEQDAPHLKAFPRYWGGSNHLSHC